jgi:hypothetical protein
MSEILNKIIKYKMKFSPLNFMAQTNLSLPLAWHI